MDANCEVIIMALVKEHFSSAVDGDATLVWESVRGVDFDDAKGAIIKHRMEKGSQAWRPDIQRVKTLAYEAHRNRTRTALSASTVIDFIRRNNLPGSQLPKGKDAIIYHFAGCWAAVQESGADRRGIILAQAYILSHCRMALREIGDDEKEADRVSRDCVDLNPGQRIKSVGIFQTKYVESLKSNEELTKLGYAERDRVSVAEGAGI